jgi:hypothetical protein
MRKVLLHQSQLDYKMSGGQDTTASSVLFYSPGERGKTANISPQAEVPHSRGAVAIDA